MVKKESSFLSHDGRTRIHCVTWLPESAPAAVLQISHGVAEYVERYEPLAEYLCARGFAVAGNDHIGHGLSVAPGAAPLYFGGKGSWFQVADDLYTLRTRVGREFPDIPYCLLGHSMGSFLARTYLIRYPGTVNAAVLSGTGQMSPLMTAGGRIIAAAETARIGAEHDSPVVTQLAFGAYNKRFAPNRTGFDWISLDTDNVDRYIADPLCGGSASIGLFREMLSGLDFIRSPRNLRQMNGNTPVLFLSGSMDPVGDCGKGVQQAFESFRRAGVRDVSMKLYPGMRHEILNDLCRQQAFEDICRWLTEKTGIDR
jgi:alpha-beta hydrolase superfamily lysophospholipase